MTWQNSSRPLNGDRENGLAWPISVKFPCASPIRRVFAILRETGRDGHVASTPAQDRWFRFRLRGRAWAKFGKAFGYGHEKTEFPLSAYAVFAQENRTVARDATLALDCGAMQGCFHSVNLGGMQSGQIDFSLRRSGQKGRGDAIISRCCAGPTFRNSTEALAGIPAGGSVTKQFCLQGLAELAQSAGIAPVGPLKCQVTGGRGRAH